MAAGLDYHQLVAVFKGAIWHNEKCNAKYPCTLDAFALETHHLSTAGMPHHSGFNCVGLLTRLAGTRGIQQGTSAVQTHVQSSLLQVMMHHAASRDQNEQT